MLARPQIGEGVEEPRLRIHLPKQLRDADTWHHGVNRPLQAHRGGGRHRVMWRDLQSPAFNPDTGEGIAFQGVVHLVKAFRQRGPAISQPGLRTGLEASVPHDGFGIASGHEIAVETAILTAAIDPDIPGAQTVSQGGDNGGFVNAPLRLTVLNDLRPPMPGGERHGRIIRQLALAGLVLVAQHGNRVLELIPRIGGIELEGYLVHEISGALD